jgi:diguanylate cyclase (GGDEF)-like protein
LIFGYDGVALGEWDDETFTEQADLATLEARVEARDRAYLIVLAGATVGEMYKLPRGEATIGRSGAAEIRIHDDGVSRAHAKIQSSKDGAQLVLEDLKSRNGTYVNGKRVEGSIALADGDKIQIGRTTILKFSYHDALDESFHEQMYESALRDGLTKLFNKRYFLERLDAELRFARRHSTSVAVLMADVDHFKKVNDTHGHLAGDAVLSNIAGIVLRAVRNEDVVARFGGEELCIILRAIPIKDSVLLGERLRRLVAASSTHDDHGATIKVTISIGVAGYPEHDVKTAAELVEAADQALYRAKNAGRDRVSQ